MSLKPHVMDHLVNAFKDRRNNRLTEHKRIRKAAEQETATLNALEQFRQERLDHRRDRNGDTDQRVTVPQQAQESRFDGRLVDAIRQQSETIEKINHASAESARELDLAQRKLAAMQVLLDRQNQRKRQADLRAEQKIADELAGKHHLNHS
ncbi:MAG: flagellar FliJ family protein [Burkholderiaceae bacterium]